jgi:formylglycine-generating enzyme required for sulfatase activity
MQSLKPLPSQGEQCFSFEVVRVNPQGEVLHRGQGSATCRRLDLGQGLSLELVWVPGGTFTMGSPAHEPPLGEGAEYYRDLFNAERPQHRVTVAEFWLGKYPVTQAQYGAVMGQNPSQFKGDDRPVEQVSWDEAMAFCDRLSDLTGQTCTLPSEAQWE